MLEKNEVMVKEEKTVKNCKKIQFLCFEVTAEKNGLKKGEKR